MHYMYVQDHLLFSGVQQCSVKHVCEIAVCSSLLLVCSCYVCTLVHGACEPGNCTVRARILGRKQYGIVTQMHPTNWVSVLLEGGLATFSFSRERLRRVFRKKHLQNYVSSTSSHLHLCTSTFSPISLLMFTSAHLHLCSSSSSHIYISAHVHICTSTSLLIFTSSHHLCSSSHPHIISAHLHILTSTAHIFTSRSSELSLLRPGSAAGPPRNATLCGDRACRVREMQARVRFVPVSAEIVRVECAKCRRGCDWGAGR